MRDEARVTVAVESTMGSNSATELDRATAVSTIFNSKSWPIDREVIVPIDRLNASAMGLHLHRRLLRLELAAGNA